MNYTNLLISAVLGLGVSSAVAEVDLTKLPPASAQKDITYAKDIKPLFEASCFRCHGEKQKKGGIRLDSLEAVLKGGKEGKIVEVNDALKSHLLISVSQLDPETAMPPKPKARKGPGGQGNKKPEAGANAPAGGPGKPPADNLPPAKPLTPEQVGLVRAWIDQGAK
jgi:mono/diheme cytochrome c family protein